MHALKHARTRRAGGIVGLALGLVLLIVGPAISAQRLTLTDAFTRAVAADPALSAAGFRVVGARANLRQAGRLPNPAVSATMENFAGTGSTSGFGRAETTFSVHQPIELGGDRAARTDIARSELEAARLRRQIRALDLFRDVEVAWAEALAAQAQVKAAEERLAMVSAMKAETDRRVQAARDPAFASARASALVAQARIARDQAQSAAQAALAALASYWGGPVDFELNATDFERVDEAALTSADVQAPDLGLPEAQARAARARVALEEARAVPDPTVYVGARRLNQDGSYGVVAGVSVTIPLFDDNSGNIARAEADERAALQEVRALEVTRERDIARLRARLFAALAEAGRIGREIIPQAEKSVRLVRDGIRRGAFSYLDASEAQRLLSEARMRQIEVLRSFHVDLAALNRLTGRHLSMTTNGETR
jgi:cobalt-zinc-cadmium efflux system outer membrane protein